MYRDRKSSLSDLGPGERSLIWSFNHDSGAWEVVGLGTVSADGQTIESDPGVGILAPGWHGTSPGDCGGSGGPPPMPPSSSAQTFFASSLHGENEIAILESSPGEIVTEHPPIALDFITGEAATNFVTQIWTAPPENPNAPSSPPIEAIEDCEIPQNDFDEEEQQPFIYVGFAE